MTAVVRDPLFEAQLMRAIGYAPTEPPTPANAWRRSVASPEPGWRPGIGSGPPPPPRCKGKRRRAWRPATGRVPAAASSGLRTTPDRGSVRDGRPARHATGGVHRREVESFRRSVALLEAPPEIVRIPYLDRALPGYFFRPPGATVPGPTLILTNGYDGSAEELYFTERCGRAARGYNVLAFDGPGRARWSSTRRALPSRLGERIRPVVDFAWNSRRGPELGVGLMGLSFGGYLLPPGGDAREHRLRRVSPSAVDPTICSTPARAAAAGPGRGAGGRDSFLLGLLERMVRFGDGEASSAWLGTRRNLQRTVSVPTLSITFRIRTAGHLRRSRRFAAPPSSARPTLDALSVDARKLFDALTCPKKRSSFKAADWRWRRTLRERGADRVPLGGL